MILKRKNQKGFTLIELVIVMVIIGILAVISVPIYRQYVRRSMASEGRSLVGAVATAEKVWFAERGVYIAVPAGTINDATLGVNAGANTYFRTWGVTVVGGAAPSFTVTASGAGDAAGITVTLIGTPNASPTMSETGL